MGVVEKPADSPQTIPAYLHDAVMQLLSEDRLNRVKVNDAVRLVGCATITIDLK